MTKSISTIGKSIFYEMRLLNMKTVIIGDGSSLFIKNHIKDVCEVVFSKVILLSSSKIDRAAFDPEIVKVYYIGSEPGDEILSEKDRLYLRKKRWNEICDSIEDGVDVLQVHFCYGGNHMYCYKKLLKKCNKRIMVYWGSDLLRADKYNLDLNIDAIRESNEVICLTGSLKKVLVDQYGDLVNNKTRILDFGVSYSEIDEISSVYSREECKKTVGFPEDKICIMIGYNGSRGQQHLLVIKALERIDISNRKRLFVFFPMSYGADIEYRLEVEREIKRLNISYSFLDLFVSRRELMVYRIATDIVIHAQITDALSASICEAMYSGATLINPKWIDYPEFNDYGLRYYEYGNFEELSLIIQNCISRELNFESYVIEDTRLKLRKINERSEMIKKWKLLLSPE